MSASSVPIRATAPTTTDAPIQSFANCHTGILRHLQALDELPALLAPAARARQTAEASLAFFRAAVLEHHHEEERELFPAVLASALPGAEREQVRAMTERLTTQHRVMEALWTSLEKDLKRVAAGKDSELDVRDLHRLVAEYIAHAGFEEVEFLPLAQTILGRNRDHMAALDLALHMRHLPAPHAYI